VDTLCDKNMVTLCQVKKSFLELTSLQQPARWGSVVGIASRYGLDRLGIESWWGRDLPHMSRPAQGLNQSLIDGYWVSLPGVKR
jgi:hypothetical protein